MTNKMQLVKRSIDKVHFKRITRSTFGGGIFVVHHVHEDDDGWQHFFEGSYEIAPTNKKQNLFIAS